MSRRYIEGFPSRLNALLEESPTWTRGLEPRDPRFVAARVIASFIDNYVKVTDPARYLRDRANNTLIVNENGCCCGLAENKLLRPCDRTEPVCLPYSDALVGDFFEEYGDKIVPRRAGGSRTAWHLDFDEIGFVDRSKVPTVEHRKRFHMNVIVPSVPANSSSREHFKVWFLDKYYEMTNGSIVDQSTHWIHVYDTEYVFHLFAWLERIAGAQEAVIRGVDLVAVPKASASTSADDLVPLAKCPALDATLVGRKIERIVRTKREYTDGTSKTKNEKNRGTVAAVYDMETGLPELIAANLADQQDWHQILVAERAAESELTSDESGSDAEKDDDDDGESKDATLPAPTEATAEAALWRPFREGNPKAAASSRWVKIVWDPPAVPSGDQIILLQKREYRLGRKNGDWRILTRKTT